jgi:hypothetical protein
MQYLLTPMNSHPDLGLGVSAEAFKEAADDLEKKSGLLTHLPRFYLQRHACELFLKSLIVLLEVKFVEKATVETVIRSLSREHGLKILFDRFQSVLVQNQKWLKENTRTDWTLPENIGQTVDQIDAIDPNSTYFRYPVTKDRESDRRKDHSKASTPSKVSKKMRSSKSGRKVLALVVENQKGEIEKLYEFGEQPDTRLAGALHTLTNVLSGAHTATRIELYKGF